MVLYATLESLAPDNFIGTNTMDYLQPRAMVKGNLFNALPKTWQRKNGIQDTAYSQAKLLVGLIHNEQVTIGCSTRSKLLLDQSRLNSVFAKKWES